MSASSGEEWGPSPWEPMTTPDLALLGVTLLHQLVVLCAAVHLVWKRDWPPYVTKNVTLVAVTGVGSSLYTLGGLVAYGALDREGGDLLAICGVEALLTSLGMALLVFPACVRVYRNYRVLVRHSASMWTSMVQLQLVSLPFLVPAITYTLDPSLTEFEDYRNRCFGNSGINLTVFAYMAATVSVGTALVARMKAKRARKQLDDSTIMMTSLAFLVAWVLYLMPTGHWFWDDSPNNARRLVMVDSIVSTAVLFWYPVFVPLLKYLQQDYAYISQFTFGFSKLPTPAQIRASLAGDDQLDQLGVDDLRGKIRNYSLSRVAPEVSEFFKACIRRERVGDYLELQAVTTAIVDRFVVEGGEQEMDVSQGCRKRVLESELSKYNIFDEAITEILSVMEVNFEADVHRSTSCQRLNQEGQRVARQPPVLSSKPDDSGERPSSRGKALGTWWPQPPGFSNPFTRRQQSERRKEEKGEAGRQQSARRKEENGEAVASSPGTESRVVGGLAGVGGGGGSGSRFERQASLGGDGEYDDDGEGGVRLERHRDPEEVAGTGTPTSPARGKKWGPRRRPSADDGAAPGVAPAAAATAAAAAGGSAPRREGYPGGVGEGKDQSIVLTSHLRELATQIGSPCATTPTGCVLSPRVVFSADVVSAGDGPKASPRSTAAAAAAPPPPPPSWGRRDSETGGGADGRYETPQRRPQRRPHLQGQGRGLRGRAIRPGGARPGGGGGATGGLSKDRGGGGGGGGGGSAAGEKEGRGRGIGAKALVEDEGDENGDRSTRTTTADTAVSSDAERGGGGGGRDALLLPRQAAGGGGGVAAEPGRGGIEFLLASSSATTEPGAPAVVSTPMAPTAVGDRPAFTPATAAARSKSSKTSSRFVSPSRIARFFGGRELWRWSRGGSVGGVESFSDSAGDADAAAGDSGISAPCAEGVGVASLIARGDSFQSPARWYTPSSSTALGRSPAAARSGGGGGGSKRHHHLPRPLSKKDPETTPPRREADVVQTPPMPPLPRRPVPRQWADSRIPLEKQGGGGTDEAPAAKVAAADGDDNDGGATTPVPPATRPGAVAADAVGAVHDAERDRPEAASCTPEDRSAAREQGTGGGEKTTPPSSPRALQELVKSQLNSFNTTVSSLASESSDYYTRLRSFAALLVGGGGGGDGGGSDKSVSGSPPLLSIPLAVPAPAGRERPSDPPPQDKAKPSSVDVTLPVDNASPSYAKKKKKKEEEAGAQTAQDRSSSRGSAREAGRTNAIGHGHTKSCGGGGGEQNISQAPSTAPTDRATSPTQVSSFRGTTPPTSPVKVPTTLWSSPAATPRRKDKAVGGAAATTGGGGGGVGVSAVEVPSEAGGDRGRDVRRGDGVSDDPVKSRLQGPQQQEKPRSADVTTTVGVPLAVDPVLSPAALTGNAHAPAPEVVMSSRKRGVEGVVEAARESFGWSEFLASSPASSSSTAPATCQGQGAPMATPSATMPDAAAPTSTVAGADESRSSSSAKARRGGKFAAGGAEPGLRAMGGRALRGAAAAATRSFSPSSHAHPRQRGEWRERGCSSALGRRKVSRFFGPDLTQAFSEGDAPQRWSPGLRGTAGEEAQEDSARGTVVAKKQRGGGGSPFVVGERGRLDVGSDSSGGAADAGPGGGKNCRGASPDPESQRATSLPVPPLPSPTAGAAAGSSLPPFENAARWSSGRRQSEEAVQERASLSVERPALMTSPSFSSAASEESRLSSQPPETSGERWPPPVLWPSGSSSSASGTSRQLLAGTAAGDSGLVVGEINAPSSPAAAAAAATAMAMVAVEGSPSLREQRQWQRQPGPLSPRLLGEQQRQPQEQREERPRRQQSFPASLDHRDGKSSTPSPVEDSSWQHERQRERHGRLPSIPRGEEEPATTTTESSGGTPGREVDPSGGVAITPLSSSPDPPGRVELGSSGGNSSLNNSTNASSILSGSSEYYTRLRSFAALVGGGGGGGGVDPGLDGSNRSSVTAGSAVPQSSPLRPFGCPEARSHAASSPASGSSQDTAQRRGSTSPHALLPPGPNESMSMPSSLSSTPPPPCHPFDAEAGSEIGSSLFSSSPPQAVTPNETKLTAESLGMVGTTATPMQRSALESNILSFLGVRSGGGGGSRSRGGGGWGSRRSRSSCDGGGGGLFRGESFFEDDD
ncbi:unnamed protein product, partial [Ectocarpus fasciculatus]